MTQQPLDPNSPEAQLLQADELLAQAAVQQAQASKLRSSASIISIVSTILIILGCVGPICVIVALALLDGN